MNFFWINFKQKIVLLFQLFRDLNTVQYLQPSAQKLVIFFCGKVTKKLSKSVKKRPWQDDETTSENKSGIYFF